MKVLHILPSLAEGGTEQGLLTLVARGFYSGMDMDLSLLELRQGKGDLREKIKAALAPDKLVTLSHNTPRSEGYLHDAPRAVHQINDIYASLKPDTVILSLRAASIFGGVPAYFHPNIKVINFDHMASVQAGLLSKLAMRATVPRFDAVFGDSHATLVNRTPEYRHGIPSYDVPLTILEAEEPRTVSEKPETLHLLSIGRLHFQKNYVELIHACALLLKKGHPIDLTIVGDGPARIEIEKTIHDLDRADPALEIAKRIHLPGFTFDEAKIREYRQRAHIYVQPSLFEGFCLATAEALAAGIPTVATPFAGTLDYGTPENMKIIAGYSRTDIAAALDDVVTHYPQMASRMSHAAIATARVLFSEESVRQRWEPARSEIITPRVRRTMIAFTRPKNFGAAP